MQFSKELSKKFITKLCFSPNFIILVLGIIFYSQYYNIGFNFGDEGSLAYISQVLLEGQVPYIDVAIGYSVMWYYPFVVLFYLFGVNFLVLKAFLFLLAAINAMVGFHLIKFLTGRKYLAWLTTLILIAVPGPIHKIYMPIISIVSMYALLKIERNTTGLRGVILATALIAFFSLFRIEMGLMLYGILFLTIFSHSYIGELSLLKKTSTFSIEIIKSFITMLCTLLPFYLIALSQGYSTSFIGGYKNCVIFFYDRGKELLLSVIFSTTQALQGNSNSEIAEETITLMQRIPFSEIFSGNANSAFAFLTYIPAVIMIGTILFIITSFILHYSRNHCFKHVNKKTPARFCLIFLIISCTFIQFFYFRPDPGHLVQFMPPFIILLAYFMAFFMDKAKKIKSKIDASRVKLKSFSLILCTLCTFGYLYMYTSYAYSIGYAFIGRKSQGYKLFNAENGLDLHIAPFLYTELNNIQKIVMKNSKEGDYAMCYPYMPGINYMTNRRAPKSSLYIDNAAIISNPIWNRDEIDLINAKKVKIIVIFHEWAINGTEFSKFKNWAKEFYDYLKANYRLENEKGMMQVFIRKD